MLDMVPHDKRETLDFRLRAIFNFAERARKEAVFGLANKACGHLILFALHDDPKERIVRLEIATTDLYGDAPDEAKYVWSS